jgi:hypothetical protein
VETALDGRRERQQLIRRRCAILLIGRDKTGNDRWYEEFVPVADGLYD